MPIVDPQSTTSKIHPMAKFHYFTSKIIFLNICQKFNLVCPWSTQVWPWFDQNSDHSIRINLTSCCRKLNSLQNDSSWTKLDLKLTRYRNSNDDLCQGSKTPLQNQINGHSCCVWQYVKCFPRLKIFYEKENNFFSVWLCPVKYTRKSISSVWFCM